MFYLNFPLIPAHIFYFFWVLGFVISLESSVEQSERGEVVDAFETMERTELPPLESEAVSSERNLMTSCSLSQFKGAGLLNFCFLFRLILLRAGWSLYFSRNAFSGWFPGKKLLSGSQAAINAKVRHFKNLIEMSSTYYRSRDHSPPIGPGTRTESRSSFCVL